MSLSVSKECIDTDRFTAVNTAMKGVNVKGGRPFNLRNPLAFPDFEEDGALFYSFPISAGKYVFDHIGGMTGIGFGGIAEYGSKAGLVPYNVEVLPGRVNYFGNLHVVGVESNCKGGVKFTKRDRKDRDFKKASESQPHLFANN